MIQSIPCHRIVRPRHAAAWLAAALWLCIAGPVIAADTERVPQAVEAYQRGQAALEKKDVSAAIQAFTEAAALDDNYAEPHLARAQALAELEQWEPAITAFRDAIERDSKLAAAYFGRAKVYREMGQIELALPDFDHAAQADWGNKDYAYQQGAAYLKAGQAQRAIGPLKRATDLDPQWADAQRDLGRAYVLAKKFDLGLASLQRAIELEPENKQSYLYLGGLNLERAQYAAAIKTLSQALKIDPTYREARVSRAMAAIELGEASKDPDVTKRAYHFAIDDCNEILHAGDDALAFYYRGLAQRLLLTYSDAIESFSNAIRLSPDFGDAYLRRGIVWYYLGEPDLAGGDFLQASRINYRDPHTYLWQGFAFAHDKRYIDAVAAYGRALEQDERFAEAFDNRGLAYIQMEQFPKAIADFNELIRLEPTNALAYYKRGVALANAGETDRAIDSYLTALRYQPRLAEAHRGLADVYRRVGRQEESGVHREMSDSLPAEPKLKSVPAEKK